ncbi:hypothetical protein P7K49_000775 [Saguinus oedipus]|uniref:Uncharacterized protein n=1 Tax=Saguinus oedipus TaxID=9490 RepID=A0ABQ9WCP7_SAGOE|nr:hypothetical protein P7K49_000775 [Saguinus oedipus]
MSWRLRRNSEKEKITARWPQKSLQREIGNGDEGTASSIAEDLWEESCSDDSCDGIAANNFANMRLPSQSGKAVGPTPSADT